MNQYQRKTPETLRRSVMRGRGSVFRKRFEEASIDIAHVTQDFHRTEIAKFRQNSDECKNSPPTAHCILAEL